MSRPSAPPSDDPSSDSARPAGRSSFVSRQLAVVIAFFAFSVFIRAPYLDRPLSDHHEWVTAQTMIALDNLRTQGALAHLLTPIQTYPLPADKFVFNAGMKVLDKDGNGYYTSFPPFAVIAPYLVLTLFSLDVTVLNLQLFNLAGHLCGTLLIFFTLGRVLSHGPSPRAAAAVGAVTYIFLAPNLWYGANVYSWDTFWHYLWIAGIFCVIRLDDAMRHSPVSVAAFVPLGLATFFVTYSEYQGVLFALSVALWGFGNVRRSRQYAWMIFVAMGASALAIGLTALQYSLQVGPEVWMRSLADTAGFRSYLGDYDWMDIPRNYLWAISYAILPVAALAAGWLKWGHPSWPVRLSDNEVLFAYLSAAPVIVHHVLLPQWTAVHDYSNIKSLIFVSGAMAWLFQRFSAGRDTPRLAYAGVWIALIWGFSGSIERYQRVYVPAPARYQELGREIAALADDAEVVFMLPAGAIVPQIIYYAKRNIQSVPSEEAALGWLDKHGREKGRLLGINEEYEIVLSKALKSGKSPGSDGETAPGNLPRPAR